MVTTEITRKERDVRGQLESSTESDLSDVGEIAAAAAADSDSYCSSDVLPLNHVWDWEEWDEYGVWRPPPEHEERLLKKQARMQFNHFMLTGQTVNQPTRTGKEACNKTLWSIRQ